MRKKIYTILNRIYGIMMTVSFFAGILPLIPFILQSLLVEILVQIFLYSCTNNFIDGS